MAENDGNAARWQDELYDLLRQHNVTQFAYVPDAGHSRLIELVCHGNSCHCSAIAASTMPCASRRMSRRWSSPRKLSA